MGLLSAKEAARVLYPKEGTILFEALVREPSDEPGSLYSESTETLFGSLYQ
jgi:hypothetical protein